MEPTTTHEVLLQFIAEAESILAEALDGVGTPEFGDLVLHAVRRAHQGALMIVALGPGWITSTTAN